MRKLDSRLFSEQINLLLASEYEVDIVVLDEVGSTNDWVIQQFRQGRKLPIVCFAERQTAGRGRRGRHWVAGTGSNIAMTLAWPFKLTYAELTWLPITMAMATVKALAKLGIENSQIKWPNDVLVNNKKIAGILLETVGVNKVSGYNAGPGLTVIGIGLNYDMSSVLDDSQLNGMLVTDVASTLKTVMMKPVDNNGGSQMHPLPSRNEVAAVLLSSCLDFCRDYPGNRAITQKEFAENYDYCKDRQLDILPGSGSKLTGVAQGLTDQAELVVLVNNQMRVFHSADISVRVSS